VGTRLGVEPENFEPAGLAQLSLHWHGAHERRNDSPGAGLLAAAEHSRRWQIAKPVRAGKQARQISLASVDYVEILLQAAEGLSSRRQLIRAAPAPAPEEMQFAWRAGCCEDLYRGELLTKSLVHHCGNFSQPQKTVPAATSQPAWTRP
jgi:hypothetical protein